MKIVVTLGGNALLRRGEAMTAENQMQNVRLACDALKTVAQDHQLVLSHGNGPQVGLIALQNDAYGNKVTPYPFDILGAESQAMVGYMFAQALKNVIPEKTVTCVVTQSEVAADDPAFLNPTKFIGPVYSEEEAHVLALEKGWTMKLDGQYWRRVVPSPKPMRIVEMPAIKHLVDAGMLVISGGGGGVPVIHENGHYRGIEAVIDKDYCGSLLAQELHADRLVIATDVKGVFVNWGTPEQKCIKRASPEALLAMGFAAGSMGPKVLAACEFVKATQGIASIGSLEDITAIIAEEAGTLIDSKATDIEYYP